jgi:hypothetical protein
LAFLWPCPFGDETTTLSVEELDPPALEEVLR